MKSATPELIAHLATGGPFVMADLYTFTLISGTVLRYTSAEVDIPYGGHTYTGGRAAPGLRRDAVRVVLGVEVDTLNLSVFADESHQINGTPFLKAAAGGLFDGAALTLQRVFLDPAALPAVIGGFIHFSGRVADLAMSRTEIQVTIKSDLELLNVKMPRNVYQPGCQHTLYDGGCGLDRAVYADTTSVQSGSTASNLVCGLANVAGWFDMGYVEFTGGPNAGVKRTVRSHTSGGHLALIQPLPVAPGIGDGFKVYPGCDKRQATCSAKFGNLVNFRGFPYIPVPESAL